MRSLLGLSVRARLGTGVQRLRLEHFTQSHFRKNAKDGGTLHASNVAKAAHLQPTFKYTFDGACQQLTSDQRLHYEKNGYLIIRKLVDEQKLNKFRKRFVDLCEGKVKSPGVTIMKDIALAKAGVSRREKTITKIQDLVFDEVLIQYCQLPEVLDYVECFTGPNIMSMHTMFINKPPDPGTLSSRHPLHQDFFFFPFIPANRIVCSWTAMEKVNRENGCLVALPGSHTGKLLNHGYPNWEGGVNLFYFGVNDLKQSEIDSRVFLEMETGDTVFFHPILIHGSGANRTTGYRKAMSCHYAASECTYVDLKGTFQEELTEKIVDFRKKHGIPLDDYHSVWKRRSRVVRGKQINL